MAERNHYQSVFRLLLKVAGYIGPATFNWISMVFENRILNQVEIEILERSFSMGLYSDILLEASCRIALKRKLFSIGKFPFLVEEVQVKFRT